MLIVNSCLCSYPLAFPSYHSLSSFISSPTPSLTLSIPSRSHFACHFILSKRRFPTFFAMDVSAEDHASKVPLGVDITTEDEYVSQSALLQDFINICNIDKAWIFKCDGGEGSQGMFLISQPNLLANKKKKLNLSVHISSESNSSVAFQWAPFPVEMTNASIIVPSPSGSKLLVVRNPEDDSPTHFEIWGQSQLEKEFHIPKSVHGSVYVDGWFEGISWNSDETQIAYVAEKPTPLKPTFNSSGYKKGSSTEKDADSWKVQGDWEDNWGETYAGKRQPALFVINLESGEVRAVKGIGECISVGQVVWAPPSGGSQQTLIFVGWSCNERKLGIKYCFNRPCALYAVRNPFYQLEAAEGEGCPRDEQLPAYNLTHTISSAFLPRFSPDGKYLVFLSAKTAVDSGAHMATNSLHRIDWPSDGKLATGKIIDVVPVIMSSEDGCFPGLYCLDFLSNPWLSDGSTIVLTSIWRSAEAILVVNVLSGKVSRVSPIESNASWNFLTLDGDNIVAVCSSLVDAPKIKYGHPSEKVTKDTSWTWSDVSSPIFRCSERVETLLSSLQLSIEKIPVKDGDTTGASKPMEAIFVSSKSRDGVRNPLIAVLHGGPHSVSLSSFSKSLGFLSSLGFSLLIVNYRGSWGFGEEALQSLPGKVGSQDVNDVLTAIDHVIGVGLTSPSKIALLGGSHGGFLTTHLIGQAPDKFAAAAVRNPVCDLALMVGTTDIPDWCYVEACGTKGKDIFTKPPSVEKLALLHSKSPISHLSKVKTPTLFLLGAQDLRVPVSNGLHYAQALKEKGVDIKIILFPKDVHSINRPQSDFESFLNIGLWFKKHCK